ERLGFQPLGIKKPIKTQKKRLGNFLEFQKRLGNFIGNVSNIRETAWKRFGGVSGAYSFPPHFQTERPPVFDDDQYEEELMPVYDIAIESLRKKKDLSGKEDLVGKKTTSKTL
nr:hypothetical protein [Tanacetum cinerariifolium]